VVKKMGAWTTGKWSKGKSEKEGSKASKQRGRLEGGTGPDGEGGRPGPWLTGGRWRKRSGRESKRREGKGAYKRKGWWRMYCHVVRMCISDPSTHPLADLLTPFLLPARNATAREQRPLQCRLDRSTSLSLDLLRRFTRSNPAMRTPVRIVCRTVADHQDCHAYTCTYRPGTLTSHRSWRCVSTSWAPGRTPMVTMHGYGHTVYGGKLTNRGICMRTKQGARLPRSA
jgi:hypothetical protein